MITTYKKPIKAWRVKIGQKALFYSPNKEKTDGSYGDLWFGSIKHEGEATFSKAIRKYNQYNGTCVGIVTAKTKKNLDIIAYESNSWNFGHGYIIPRNAFAYLIK